MWKDPIVEEVRNVRQELFDKCGNDLGRFFEFIRRAEVQHGDRLITSKKRQSCKSPSTTPETK